MKVTKVRFSRQLIRLAFCLLLAAEINDGGDISVHQPFDVLFRQTSWIVPAQQSLPSGDAASCSRISTQVPQIIHVSQGNMAQQMDRLPDILDFSIADFPEKHKEEQRQSPLPNHSLKRPKKGSHHKNW